jgi:uncharacterized protein
MTTPKNKYGLTEAVMTECNLYFNNTANLKEVWIFGSRHRGDYKKTSDIDLCLILENIDEQIEWIYLYNMLEESVEIWNKVDIVVYNKIVDNSLKAQIDENHDLFWSKELKFNKV